MRRHDTWAESPLSFRRNAWAPTWSGRIERVQLLEIVGCALLVGYVLALVWMIGHTDFDLWGGFLLAPIAFVVSVPILYRLLRSAGEDLTIVRLFILGLGIKLVAAFFRYYVVFVVIGTGDAQGYHLAGVDLAAEFRGYELGGEAYQTYVGSWVGTPFIRFVTGIVYTVVGPTKLGGFVVFSMMSFWGIYFFYRAFRTALPDGLERRYLLFLILLPSLVFWPSSIGKDSWMVLMLGITAYGAARMLTGQRHGLIALAAGFWGTAMVRPHITAILFVALVVAYLVRRNEGENRRNVWARLVGVMILLVAGALLMGRVQAFFGIDGIDGDSFDAVLSETTRRTSQGGSAFESARPTSILQTPYAIITVLFRPFPNEANNIQAMISAIEGVFLLSLFAFSFVRFAALPKMLRRRPYVTFALAYSLTFVFAFSAVANFGILVRQRAQLLPIVVVLLCVPARTALEARSARFRAKVAPQVPAATSPSGQEHVVVRR